ncbi:MAG TPA: MFS transporter [Candidatus Nanopelagicaceae bacterium]|nr:MFS transporter [Candidatus Nanopelagicaceae bacterium]
MLNKEIDSNRFTPDFTHMLKIVILNSLGFFFIGFLVPIIARLNMSATAIQISLIVSIQVLGRTISGTITGFLTDRVKSKKKLVLIGSIGRGTSYFIIYTAIILNSVILLGIGTFTLGFMAGVFWVPFNTLIAEKSNKNNRSEAYGKRNSANAIGQMIGGVIGFILLTSLSFFTSNPFLLYASIPLFGFANFYAGFKFNREVDESIKFNEPLDNLTNPLIKENKEKHPKLAGPIILGSFFLMLVLFLSNINGSIAKPFLNIYAIENIEENVQLVTWAYLPAGIVATLLAPKLGIIVDKFRPALGITITSLLGAMVTWLLVNAANIWVFSFLLLIDMTIMIASGLIFQNLLSRISLKNRGKMLGSGEFFQFLGSVIGPILGGVVWDFYGPSYPFIISIFVELSLIPLYLVVVYYLIPHLAENYSIENEKKSNKKINNT